MNICQIKISITDSISRKEISKVRMLYKIQISKAKLIYKPHPIEMIDTIQSTYMCTPYQGSSVDLIQAVARQYKFAFKVTKNVNWNAPEGIINGIRQYSTFLAVIKNNPELTAVPTIEIGKYNFVIAQKDISQMLIFISDLAWHTHMLHHDKYRKFTMRNVGRLVNHDDTIPEDNLKK